MRSTENRIADLETRLTPKEAGRAYGVCGGPVGANPADFIRSHGLLVDDERDLILHHVPFAPSPDGPQHVEMAWGWVGKRPAGATQ